MTEQEKKMNKLDLKSYKVGDNAIHSMIPGINNIQSVGSTPLIRKGANINLSPAKSLVLSNGGIPEETSGHLMMESARYSTTNGGGLARNQSSGALINSQFKYALYD